MMKFMSYVALFMALVAVRGDSQSLQRPQRESVRIMASANECMAKGGIGIIVPDLYIDLTAPKNELVLAKGKRWDGKGSGDHETVFFFDHRVWASGEMPASFDLSKAFLISFEGPIVRFFDFNRERGGYYSRPKI